MIEGRWLLILTRLLLIGRYRQATMVCGDHQDRDEARVVRPCATRGPDGGRRSGAGVRRRPSSVSCRR